jgi:hypothetical protein
VENRDGTRATVENQPEMSVPGGLIRRGILDPREPKGAEGERDWPSERD